MTLGRYVSPSGAAEDSPETSRPAEEYSGRVSNPAENTIATSSIARVTAAFTLLIRNQPFRHGPQRPSFSLLEELRFRILPADQSEEVSGLRKSPVKSLPLLVPPVHSLDEAAGSVIEPGADRLDFLAEASG